MAPRVGAWLSIRGKGEGEGRVEEKDEVGGRKGEKAAVRRRRRGR
jgi:hypothetical protein